MTTQFDRIQNLFVAALDQPPADRAPFLNEACAGDSGVRQEVEKLLDAHFEASGPLDRAAVATIDMPPVAEKPGTQIGPYKLLQQIGEGGFGVVYMAEQHKPVRRKVALKIIKPGMDTKEVIARFEAERQALAMMDHVNIARVLDAGATESGRPYFVMELVHGVPITTYCDDNRLTPRQRLELFVPVCQAIQHAHQKGIIHRDIKPSNVMVTHYDGKPVPKVIDFGVAKATEQKLTERTLFTEYGTLVGTLEYMSPEQAEISALGVDTRSDIYSLGVLLYELLAGSTPLSGKRMKVAARAEILRLIKEEEPPRPSTRLTESGAALASISAQRHTEPARLSKMVRGELDWIVMKTLEKDRNRRYETASAFAADLQRYLQDEPVQACPPSALYRFRKLARRNKVALTTAAVISAALVVGALVSTWQAVRASRAAAAEREQRQEADDARQQAVGDRERALQAEQHARRRLLDARLAQAKASRWSGRVGQRFESLKALKEAARIARTLPDTGRRLGELRDEAIACLALTDVRLIREWEGTEPRSRRSAWFDADLAHYARMDLKGGVSICAAADGRELARISGTDNRRFSLEGKLAFSPAGDRIAILDRRDHVQVWDWRRRVRVFETAFPISQDAVSFSPDGRQLAVGQKDGTIVTFELAGGKEVRRLRGLPQPNTLAFHPDGTRLAVASRRRREVAVYEVAGGRVIRKLAGHPAGVWDVAWHPQGDLLATTSGDNAYLWDAATGRQLAVLQGHQASVVRVHFLPPGNRMVTTSWDATTRVWEAATGRFLMSVPGGLCRPNRDGSRLAAITGGSGLGLWEVAASREYRLLSSAAVGRRDFLHDGGISRDGRWLAIGEETGVRLWDLALGRETAFLKTGPTLGVAFHPRDGTLLTSGPVGLYRWPVRQQAETLRVGPPRRVPLSGAGAFQRVHLNAAGRVLAVASFAGGHVVNLEGPPAHVPLLKHRAANQVTVSPDGRWVATGTHNGYGIKVWDAKSGRLIRDLQPDARTSFVLFSPDGRRLASSTGDEIRLWEAGSWKLARRFAAAGLQMAFTPDGKTLALLAARDVVQLVDPATGRCIARLQAPETVVPIAFSADGSQLFVRASRSPNVRVWDLRLVGEELKAIGLTWDLPPFAPPRKSQAVKAVKVKVDLGELRRNVKQRRRQILGPWRIHNRATKNKPVSGTAGPARGWKSKTQTMKTCAASGSKPPRC